MKEFRYFRLGVNFLAIHPNEMTVYSCSDLNPWYTYAKVETSVRMYTEVETNKLKQPIEASEFQQHFSNAVSRLHNETPFA